MAIALLHKLGYLLFALTEDILILLGAKAGISAFTIIGIVIVLFLLWVFVPQFKKFVLMHWRKGIIILLIVLIIIFFFRLTSASRPDIFIKIHNVSQIFNDTDFLTGFDELDPIFLTGNSSIYNYLADNNFSWSRTDNSSYLLLSGGTLFGNLSLTNGNYFSGQPIDGAIGSGIINASSLKVHCGCINASDMGGLNVWYPNMTVRIWNFGDVKYCNVIENTISVPNDAHTVYYIDSNCAVQTETWTNYFAQDLNPPNYIRIFDVYAIDGDIEIIKGGSVSGINTRKSKWNDINCGGGHLSVCDGMDITEGTFPEISMSAGHFKYVNSVSTSVQRDSNPDGLHIICTSDESHTAETEIDIDKCDNGVSCDACPTNKYRRYIIGSIGWGVDHTRIHQLAPLDDETYTTLANCINIEKYPLDYTIPSNVEGVFVPLAFYCGKRDDTAWSNGFVDLRLSGGGFGASPDLSGFVTYTEANQNVDLGNYNLTTNGTGTFTTLNVTGTSYLKDFVLDGNIDLGNGNLTTTGTGTFGIGIIGENLTVNNNMAEQHYLVLKGYLPGAPTSSRGGSIFWADPAGTDGYMFINSQDQLVLDTTAQDDWYDTGNAYIGFDGSGRFTDDVEIDADSKKLYFGESQDASNYFDSKNLIFNAEVGFPNATFQGFDYVNLSSNVLIDGKVGIGFPNPSYPLEIYENDGLSIGHGGNHRRKRIYTDAGSSPYDKLVISSQASAWEWRGMIDFRVSYTSGGTIQTPYTAMTILANTDGTTANVGIGVTDPDSALEVTGEVHITDLNTGENAGSDICVDTNGRLCECGSCA